MHELRSVDKGRCRTRSYRRGASLIEALATVLILSFVVTATLNLYRVGDSQQRLARSYSSAQTALRSALRTLTRTLRHGKAVVGTSSAAGFPVKTSSASQAIVQVPEPTGTTPDTVEVRFYLSAGTVYAQRADQAAPGTALMTGVTGLSFSYFATSGTSRTSVDGAPATANSVQVRVTGLRGKVTSAVDTEVTLRNALAGSL